MPEHMTISTLYDLLGGLISAGKCGMSVAIKEDQLKLFEDDWGANYSSNQFELGHYVDLNHKEQEEKVLHYLATAFNEFVKLESQHPNELADFVDGIHRSQYIVGMRYARKYREDLFPIKKNTNS